LEEDSTPPFEPDEKPASATKVSSPKKTEPADAVDDADESQLMAMFEDMAK
jgi:hypothetical protein